MSAALSETDIVALRRSIEADRRQLAELTERIRQKEAELERATSTMMDTSDDGGVIGNDEAPDDTDDIISQVLMDTDLMLLGSAIFPYLDGTGLGRSSRVSMQWRRSAEIDSLWKALALKMWPDCVARLVTAGVIGSNANGIGAAEFRAFYRRRMMPQVIGPPSVADDDELFVIIDMPNLVESDSTGQRCLPLKPIHRVFPLSEAFRAESHHQSIFEEPHCDCFPDDGQVHNILEHSHPSAWLNFPFERKTFMAHPQRTSSSTTPENVFALDLSIVRKSDGKILKMVESSSFECEVEAPDGYLAPWIMYKRNLPGPALPDHTGFRPLGPREERSYRKIFAGLDAEYPDSFDEDSIEYEGQDPHPLVFEIRHVIFGITLASDDDDPFNERMVPLNSNEKLGMFLDMSRLEWM